MSIKVLVRQGGGTAAQPDLANLAEPMEGVPVFDTGGAPLIDMAQRWEQGQAGQGTYIYQDMDGSASYRHRPHAEVKLIEDDSGTDYVLAWGRMEGGNDTGRPMGGRQTLGHGRVEHNPIQVMDCNMDLRGLPFRTVWSRPAETSWQRLEALQARSLNGGSSTGGVKRTTTVITVDRFTAGHLVHATDTVDMDANDYPVGTTPAEVMEDIFSQWEGKRWGVTLHHEEGVGTHKCLLVLNPEDHETFSSALRISDHLEDFDPDSETAPTLAPEWRRGAGKTSDNSDVISGLISIYGGTTDNPRHLYVSTADPEDEYETWVDVYHDDVARNATQAERRANKILQDRKRPYNTPQPSIRLHPSQVTLITAGISIEVKSVVLNQGADRNDFVWWHIAEIRWEPLPDGDWMAHLQLGRGRNAGLSNGGGGPTQPGSTSPKPAPEHVPDPGDTTEHFYTAEIGSEDPFWDGILPQGSSGDGAAGTDRYFFKSSAPDKRQESWAASAGDTYRIEGYVNTASAGQLTLSFHSDAPGTDNPTDTTLTEAAHVISPAQPNSGNTWVFFTAGPYTAPVGTTSAALGRTAGVSFDELSIFLVGDPAANDEDAVDYGDYPHSSTHWLPSDYVEARLDEHSAQIAELPQAIRDALSWKEPVRVATTANGTLASAFENGDTVDGVTLATGDRILLKDQTTGADRGIYTVNASGAPTRATDFDASAEVLGAVILVTEGTANADKVYVCTTNAPITLGTTSLSFTALGGGSGSVATDTIWDAKGDLAAGTGADTASKLTVGADDTILMADASTGTGLKWVASASPSAVGTAAATGTADTFTRGDHVHAHEAAHVAHDTIYDAKGDIIAGTGSDAAARLAVGSNGKILVADSAETTGLKWATGGSIAVTVAGNLGDIPPTSPGTYDEEFLGTADTLPANYAWTSAPSGSDAWFLNSRWPSLLTVEGTGNTDYTLTISSFSAAATFGIWAKVYAGPFTAADIAAVRMYVANSGFTEARGINYRGSGSRNTGIRALKIISSSETVWGTEATGFRSAGVYIGLTRDGSNNFTSWFSNDGVAWDRLATAESHTITIDRIRFTFRTGSILSLVGLDWIRYRTDNAFPRP